VDSTEPLKQQFIAGLGPVVKSLAGLGKAKTDGAAGGQALAAPDGDLVEVGVQTLRVWVLLSGVDEARAMGQGTGRGGLCWTASAFSRRVRLGGKTNRRGRRERRLGGVFAPRGQTTSSFCAFCGLCGSFSDDQPHRSLDCARRHGACQPRGFRD
jgi:hypothetical protein